MLCNRKGKPRALKKCAATWMALDHSFWASLETEVLTSQSYGFWVENLGKHSPIPWVVRVLESILGHGSKRQFTSWKSKWGFDHNFTTEPSNFSTDLIGNLMPGQLGQGLAGTQLSLVLCWFMAFKGPASVSLEMWPLCGISVPIPSSSGLMPHFLFLYAVTFKTPGDGD